MITVSLFYCSKKMFTFYEYMEDWEKFNETLPKKEDFYSHLNMKDITDADSAYAKRVSKYFKIKNSGNYYVLYVQSDTLLLADVFENFKDMSWNIWTWSLLLSFRTRISIALASSFKKTKVIVGFLTDINMLLMVEKSIRGTSILEYK